MLSPLWLPYCRCHGNSGRPGSTDKDTHLHLHVRGASPLTLVVKAVNEVPSAHLIELFTCKAVTYVALCPPRSNMSACAGTNKSEDKERDDLLRHCLGKRC